MKLAPAFLPQNLAPRAQLDWHSHAEPYAALVLAGGYAESGDGGRFRAEPGHVVIHTPFSAHADRVSAKGAVVVNLPLAIADSLSLQSGIVADPEGVLRLFAEDPSSLGETLRASLAPLPISDDLPDRLAAALERPDAVGIADWAVANAVSPRTITRHFTAAFGIAPAHYRWRARVRAAWRSLVTTDQPLITVAHDWGFADQAHMSRSVRQLTGRPPNWWRKRLSD
jgi:AraC-like DNA-binding protein